MTLSWSGKDRALAGESYDEAEPLRTWSTADDASHLHAGDNLAALRSLAARYADKVTLAYLDPPFLTNKIHEALIKKDGERFYTTAFDDRWSDQAAYLEAIAPRLVAIRALLAPHGSVVIHVDPKTSHYLKVLADEVFGADAFASEIVWRYRRWPAKTPNFQRVHDVLLRYRKDPKVRPRWNQPYEPLAASTLATWGTKKQRAVVGKDGRRARSSSTSVESAGVPMGDVWDIGVIAPIARERTGYPSQKPEALLERLVGALSDPDDVVLDPYAGSGTTLAVAARMGRAFLGIDRSEVAIETARARLAAAGIAMTSESESEKKRPELVSCPHPPPLSGVDLPQIAGFAGSGGGACAKRWR